MTHYHDADLNYHHLGLRQVKGPRAMPSHNWAGEYLDDAAKAQAKGFPQPPPRVRRFGEADRVSRIKLMAISRELMRWDRKTSTALEVVEKIRKLAEGDHG